jgi:hypothetical protein
MQMSYGAQYGFDEFKRILSASKLSQNYDSFCEIMDVAYVCAQAKYENGKVQLK